MSFPNTPIKTPTTLEIKEFILNYYYSALGITYVPPKSVIATLAGALAAIYVIAFRMCTWSFQQIFLETADRYWVEVQGRELGIIPKEGSKAVMTCEVTGVTASSIPGDTLYQYNNNVYKTLGLSSVTNGIAQFQIESENIGTAYNIEEGEIIYLVQPIVGVPPTALITLLGNAASDPESFDDYYKRVSTRKKQRPQGGAPIDYYQWALDAPSIVDCYVYELESGEIDVYPLKSGFTSIDRLPRQSDISSVISKIETSGTLEYYDRRPLTAKVNVKAASAESFSVSVYGFGVGRPQELRNQINLEVSRYFSQRAPLIPSLGKIGNINTVNKNALITIINTLTEQYGFSITNLDVILQSTRQLITERPVPQYTISELEGSVNVIS